MCPSAFMSHTSKPPRFDGLRAASPSSSYAKKQCRKKDTRPELLLRKTLWALGFRYRLHTRSLPGNPDIVFPSQHLAVFVDGDFWHGRDWKNLRTKLERRANPDYWMSKIAYNIARDQKNEERLRNLGWHVRRVWEKDILRDPAEQAQRIAALVEELGLRAVS